MSDLEAFKQWQEAVSKETWCPTPNCPSNYGLTFRPMGKLILGSKQRCTPCENHRSSSKFSEEDMLRITCSLGHGQYMHLLIHRRTKTDEIFSMWYRLFRDHCDLTNFSKLHIFRDRKDDEIVIREEVGIITQKEDAYKEAGEFLKNNDVLYYEY